MFNGLIYKVYLIDADSGISLLEAVFKEFPKKTIADDIIAGFFNAINRTIDNIQEAMAKGRRVNEMTRVLESEESLFIIYYHPVSRILFCSISDADDDTDKIKEVCHKIGSRFWKKHQADLKEFRTTSEKSRFQSYLIEIQNLTLGGRVAEVFPNLQVIRSVLEKILSMGMINDFDFKVAINCTGKNSPLKISRLLDTTRTEILDVLKKLEQLEIIKM